MHRTSLLVVIVLAAGCVGGPSAGETTCAAYPVEPSNVTADSAERFVEGFERAHIRDRLEDDGSVDPSDPAFRITPTRDGYVLRSEYSVAVRSGGSVGDHRVTATYFVNDSTVLRVGVRGVPERTLDPIANGTTPECVGYEGERQGPGGPPEG